MGRSWILFISLCVDFCKVNLASVAYASGSFGLCVGELVVGRDIEVLVRFREAVGSGEAVVGCAMLKSGG